jgi:hypothetical protein
MVFIGFSVSYVTIRRFLMAQLIKVTDLQVGPRENQAMNRYWLNQPAGFSLSLQDIGAAFASQHIDLVRIVQAVEWEHIALFLEDVLTGTSLLLDLIGFIGQRSGDTTPASNAYSFPLKPIGPTIKRGGKRLPGVADNDANDEVVDNAGMLGLLGGVALGMWLPLDVGGNPVEMAVVRPVGSPPTSYIVSPLVGAIYRQIGTQVSRKLSRGGGTSFSSLVPQAREDFVTEADFDGFLEPDYQEYIDAVILARQGLEYSPAEVTRIV